MSQASLRQRVAGGEHLAVTMAERLSAGLCGSARSMTMRVSSLAPFVLALALALGACSRDPAPSPASAPGLANPASENCVAKGGELRIETAGDGGQYGVCLFEDNRQCEEWALLRGACPAGGIRVTGYITPQARYCAIRGGDYAVTREATATTPEEGTCMLPGQPACDALALYEGRCS